MAVALEVAKEAGICPRCKDGNGRVFDAGSSRVNCYSCRGKGTWDAYRLHREFVKGWNAALERVVQNMERFDRKDMP